VNKTTEDEKENFNKKRKDKGIKSPDNDEKLKENNFSKPKGRARRFSRMSKMTPLRNQRNIPDFMTPPKFIDSEDMSFSSSPMALVNNNDKFSPDFEKYCCDPLFEKYKSRNLSTILDNIINEV